MEKFDFKKEYKEFYLPPRKPQLIEVPQINYIAVRGKGDPNKPDGEYKSAIGLLYGIAFTIKMSYRGNYQIEGYYDYVVPPLEGFWWQDGVTGIDITRKETFQWISLIRLPDFVKKADFDWAVAEAARKKNVDYSSVEYFPYLEGRCVQCMHIGPYDDESATIQAMAAYAGEQGYVIDLSENRYHHEIYLSDVRRCSPERFKTVIRHPIRKA